MLSLAKREREIAGIVYNKGKATANDVLACVSAPLSNAAIRSMLNRLVAKGILFRRRAVAGKQFIYVPAISNSISLERAFQQIAEDYFDGSMDEAFSALTSILIRRADSLAEAQQRRCS